MAVAWLDYPSVTIIHLGPLTFRAWGVFVALGVVAATWVAARRAVRRGIPAEQIWNLSFWVTLGGLIGARVLYIAEYWRDFVAEPLKVFAFWEGGMSAFGAILLGVLAAWALARRRGISFRPLAEAVAPALLLGDALGRLGGAASHMYPGAPTRFPLSYVLDGAQRHEVGVELALGSFAGFLMIVGLERLARQKYQISSTKSQTSTNDQILKTQSRFRFWNFGFVWNLKFGAWSFSAPLVLIWYSAERFLLDFLRASDLPQSDLRYAGLTLAQYFALAGILWVLWLGIHRQSYRFPGHH